MLSILFSTWLLSGYLSSFPKPLTRQEEKELLEKMLKGDLAARSRLAEHNLRLVAHIVQKFNLPPDKTEDLISVGSIGLLKSLDTFQPNKKSRLTTYAAKCIENEILMYLRKNRRQQNELYLQEPVGLDKNGNEITLLEKLSPAENLVSEQAELNWENQRLSQALRKLESRDQLVLTLRYGLARQRKHSQKEVADILQLSRSYVSRIEKRALQRLNKYLLPF